MTDIKIPWSEWKIVRTLGHGTFGYVYEIERDIFGDKEKAALKVLSIPQDESELEQDYTDGYDRDDLTEKYSGQLQTIVQEYQLMSEMKGHSNVVSCEDLATVQHTDGIGWDIFIRMELLTPLNRYLRGKEFTSQDVVKLGKDICKALILCEQKKIVHRDIKPENIMVSSYGDFKLGDFGIARTMDHATNATKAGTERYMAPEVIRREVYGHEVDIYSLGIVMYWLLNKRRMPFLPTDRVPGPMDMEKAQSRRIGGEKLPAPKNGSSQLKQIVLKACAYRRQDRYTTAGEMLKALENLGKEKDEIKAETPVTLYGYKAESKGEKMDYQDCLNESVREEWGETAGYTDDYGNSWNDTQGTIGKPERERKVARNEYETTQGIDYEKKQKRKEAAKEQKEVKKDSEKKSYHTLFGEVFYTEEKKNTGGKKNELPYTNGKELEIPPYIAKRKVPTRRKEIVDYTIGIVICVVLAIGLYGVGGFILLPVIAFFFLGCIFNLYDLIFKADAKLKLEKIDDGRYRVIYAEKIVDKNIIYWALAVDQTWIIAGNVGDFAEIEACPGSNITLVSFSLDEKKPNIQWKGELKVRI